MGLQRAGLEWLYPHAGTAEPRQALPARGHEVPPVVLRTWRSHLESRRSGRGKASTAVILDREIDHSPRF